MPLSKYQELGKKVVEKNTRTPVREQMFTKHPFNYLDRDPLLVLKIRLKHLVPKLKTGFY